MRLRISDVVFYMLIITSLAGLAMVMIGPDSCEPIGVGVMLAAGGLAAFVNNVWP